VPIYAYICLHHGCLSASFQVRIVLSDTTNITRVLHTHTHTHTHTHYTTVCTSHFPNTVELHLSGLIGTANRLDVENPDNWIFL